VSRHANGCANGLLEPDALKGARPVLRGEGSREASLLPDSILWALMILSAAGGSSGERVADHTLALPPRPSRSWSVHGPTRRLFVSFIEMVLGIVERSRPDEHEIVDSSLSNVCWIVRARVLCLPSSLATARLVCLPVGSAKPHAPA
jgi:hypothetical protein